MMKITKIPLWVALLALACGPLPSRDGGADTTTDGEAAGELVKIPANEGAILGSFTNQASAAFDDDVSQTAEEAAWAALYGDQDESKNIIGKEWRRPMRVSRVEVFAPSDGAFFSDPQNYPEGGMGKVHLLGQKAGDSSWTVIASQPFAASNGSNPVVVDSSFAVENKAFVKHAVRFAADDALAGLLHVAEVVFYGAPAGLPSSIEWKMSDWVCTNLACVESENTDGIQKRTVECLRDGEHKAGEALCPEPKPDTEGDTCGLSCPYTLHFVGYRPFTYANGSGWLHEGRVDSRAGPLPSSTAFGGTIDVIEGKPCSIPTQDSKTYFVGISCAQGENYCAFQCR